MTIGKTFGYRKKEEKPLFIYEIKNNQRVNIEKPIRHDDDDYVEIAKTFFFWRKNTEKIEIVNINTRVSEMFTRK